MKFILIVFIVAQIYGAFSTRIPLDEQRGLMDIWDLISPVVTPVAHEIDSALATISNAHTTVTNAVTDAIYGLTSWIGNQLPPLGKRNVENDARLSLLNELQSFQLSFRQLIREIIQNFLNGNVKIQFRQLISKLHSFLKTHLKTINNMITNLIPKIQNIRATEALKKCLHVIQVIQQAIQNIQNLFSS